MRILALFFIAALAVAQAPSSFQPVGNMSQLMIDMIYPASDAIFYVERAAPQNDRDWGALRATALTLAESGNLLMMDRRARDQGDWIKDAKMLVDAGAAAYKAAQAKNLDAIVALNNQLYTACVTCHEQYRAGYRRRQ
jgi:cytochrome c553